MSVDIDARGSKQRLLEIRDHPAALLMPISENLPAARSDSQATSPAPGVCILGVSIWCIDGIESIVLARVHLRWHSTRSWRRSPFLARDV